MTITYERRAMRFYFKWKEECTEQTNEAWELFAHGKIDQAELVKRVEIPFLINEIREAVEEEKERCAKLCDANDGTLSTGHYFGELIRGRAPLGNPNLGFGGKHPAQSEGKEKP